MYAAARASGIETSKHERAIGSRLKTDIESSYYENECWQFLARTVRSKNRGCGKQANEIGGKFVPDGDEKERKASDEMKEAAVLFLLPTYEQLTESQYNIRSVEKTD